MTSAPGDDLVTDTIEIGLFAAPSLILGLLSLNLRGLLGKSLSLCAMVLAGITLTAQSHAVETRPPWLSRPTMFLHAVGIIFWIGSLLPLSIAFARWGAGSKLLLQRFTHAIPFAVFPLAGAGMLLAMVQLPSINALWVTPYGQVLSVKLALVAMVFALAVWNRFWLTDGAIGGERAAVSQLSRSTRIELILVVAILATTALWHLTPPPEDLSKDRLKRERASQQTQ
ncbi:copper resistance D family protein [Microvirga guangxiensis]|uniref:copper resistance D family protein n=1 Tax=Microvirga guangxiensis TaxID=549386 RepID=UPI0015877B63|nr:CopD family protein [Microvirga guangxiensis]